MFWDHPFWTCSLSSCHIHLLPSLLLFLRVILTEVNVLFPPDSCFYLSCSYPFSPSRNQPIYPFRFLLPSSMPPFSLFSKNLFLTHCPSLAIYCLISPVPLIPCDLASIPCILPNLPLPKSWMSSSQSNPRACILSPYSSTSWLPLTLSISLFFLSPSHDLGFCGIVHPWFACYLSKHIFNVFVRGSCCSALLYLLVSLRDLF